MNPVVSYFTSGESRYLGVGLLALAIGASPYLNGRGCLLLRNIATWVGLAMIVLACPPFPWLFDLIFLVVFALWFVAVNQPARRREVVTIHFVATVVLLTMLLAMAGVEFSHRKMPLIAGKPYDHLVVIGDSISSGIDPRVPAWPAVFQQMTGVPVKNLSRAGAVTAEGRDEAAQVTPEDSLVLIEIGGNDLLSGVPSDEFGQHMEAILAGVVSPGRTVMMFELPLLPHKIAYGQIQRRLAAKYGIWLIPKRFFVDVLAGANATSDGLHLSVTGAQRMAGVVGKALSGVLRSGSAMNLPLEH